MAVGKAFGSVNVICSTKELVLCLLALIIRMACNYCPLFALGKNSIYYFSYAAFAIRKSGELRFLRFYDLGSDEHKSAKFSYFSLGNIPG